MTTKPTIRRWATGLSAAALLVGIVGLFGTGGPPSVSAQTDTTAPTVSSIAITSNPDDGVYGIDDSIEVTVRRSARTLPLPAGLS